MQTDIITQISHAIQQRLPSYPIQEIEQAVRDLFAGVPATIGDQRLSIGYNARQFSAHVGEHALNISGFNVVVGSEIRGDLNQIAIVLPQPIDQLEVAKAIFASLPRTTIPEPDHSALAQCSRMTMFRNEQFVGRSDELVALAEHLAESKPTVITTTGIGGVGKTNLATEFVYRYGQYFAGGVFWVDCSDPSFIATHVAACGGTQHLGLFRDDDQAILLEERVKRVLHEWQDPIPRLLIFDNCESPDILDQYRPHVGGCRIIVTARRPQWLNMLILMLGVLPRHESVLLLQKLASHLSAGQAEAIANELGDLPLALHVAGCYLDRYQQEENPEQYLHRLRTINVLEHPALKGKAFLSDESLPTKHELDVAKTFAISLDRLDRRSPISQQALMFLDYLSHLAPNTAVPRDFLERLPTATNDRFDRDDALARTLQIGLVESQGHHAVRIHQLIHEFLYQTLASTQAQITIEDVMKDFAKQIGEAGYPLAFVPYEIHARFVVKHALKEQNIRVATLINNVGVLLKNRGNFSEAEALFRQAIQIWRTLGYNLDSVEITPPLDNLAGLLQDTGRYTEAQSTYEHVLGVRRNSLGSNNSFTASSLNNSATFAARMGDFAKAEHLLREALNVFNQGDKDTATVLSNLGEVLNDQGKYNEAESYYRRALAIREKQLGLHHPDTANSYNNLSHLLYRMARYAEAEPFLRRALEINTATLGDDQAMVALTRNNLAECLRITGKPQEAESLFQQSLSSTEKTFGANHPNTAVILNNLGEINRELQRYAEAETLHRRALAIRESQLGTDHPETVNSLNNLGLLLKNTQRFEEAESLLRHAVSIRRKALSHNPPLLASSLNNLASVLKATGRYKEAEPLYREAWQIMRRVAPNHPNTQKVHEYYQELLQLLAESGSWWDKRYARKVLKQEFGL